MTTNITTLDKTTFGSSSIFENVNVYEYIDPEELYNVIHTAKLIEYDGTRYEGGVGKLYKTEKEFLTAYQYIWNEPLGCFVSQWFLKKHGWGRDYPKDNMSISIFHRPTRHTLCDKYLVDVDIINCHYEIILSFMKQLNLSCEEIEKYCENPKGIRELVSIHYNTSLDKAKSLFITLIYGGGLWKWRKDNNIDDSVKDFPMLLTIKNELEAFQKVVIEGNQHILTDILTYEPRYFDGAYEGKRERTLVSFWCQSIERYIQESCIMMLVKKHGLMLNNIVPCQDGFMLRRSDFKDEFIGEINQFIRDELKLVSKMKRKPFDEKYKIGKPPINKVFMRFDLTKAEDSQYAQYLLDVATHYNDIMTTGDGKLMLSYVYTGVYWEQGSFHTAEFYQGRMEYLQNWCDDKFKRITMAIRNDPRFDGYVDEKEKKELDKIQKAQEKQNKELKQEKQRQIKEAKQEKQKQVKERNIHIRKLKRDNINLARLDDTEKYNSNIETIKRLQEEIDEIELSDDIDIDDDDDDNKCGSNNVVKNTGDPLFQLRMIDVLKNYTLHHNNIKKLSRNITREAVAKTYLSVIHQPNIRWNVNPEWFVFNDCVYDLSKGEWVKTTSKDYINSTCGKNYHIESSYNSKEEFDNALAEARRELLKFFKSVVLEEDYPYFMKVLASFLRGFNKDEKAYFWLGDGRNGKGTVTYLLQNLMGGYWGELNMDYYTNYTKEVDRPNQNLYNCRNARVLNSSEVADGDSNDNAVIFISSKLKTLTGGDAIYAREVGTKNSVNFQAGTSLIQTNKMPSFLSIKGESIKERIVVQKYPYTFTDDVEKLKSDPEKYKKKDMTLKDMFSTDIYRRASIDILFEEYKNYQADFTIPESVKRYTNTYFNSESVKGVMEKFYKPSKPDSRVNLEDIKHWVKLENGKDISIKSLRKELEELKYDVCRTGNVFTLKGYELIPDDSQVEKNVVEEEG
jgi:phage/plasmid-associated DNA primase